MTLALTGSTSAAKWFTKSSWGSQAIALLVDAQVRQGRGRLTLGEQRPDRFALVEPEGRDVHQADDVRRVATERGHDLTAVRVSGDHGGTGLHGEHLPHPRDVVRQ